MRRHLPPLAALLTLLLAAGAPASPPERGWPQPLSLTDANVVLRGSAAAMLPSGEVAVAWGERQADGATRLFVRSKLADGTLGPATVRDERGSAPVLAAGASGELLLGWTHDPGDSGLPQPLVAARGTDGVWSDPVDLDARGFGGGMAIAAGPDGDAAAVFVRDDALVTAYRPAGGAFGEPVVIPDSEHANAQSLALGERGQAVFAWMVERPYGAQEVRVARRDGDGPVDRAAALSAPGQMNRGVTVAIGPEGRALVAWLGPEGDMIAGPVRAAVGQPDGSWTPAAVPAASTDARPSIALDTAGDALLAWTSFESTGTGGAPGAARYAEGDLATGQFGAAHDIDPFFRTQGGVQIAMAPDGAAVLLSHDGVGEAHVNRRPAGGAFGQTRTVVCPVPAHDVLLALGPAGEASVLLTVGNPFLEAGGLALAQDSATSGAQRATCTVPPAVDNTVPVGPTTITLVKGQHLRMLARRALRVSVQTPIAGMATIDIGVDAATARWLRSERRVAHRRVRLVASQPTIVKVKFPRRIARKLARRTRVRLALRMWAPGGVLATRAAVLRR